MSRSFGPWRIICSVGTRPEAIKMAPVIRALRAAPWARCRVLFTAQHRDLATPILEFFGIEPDIDLDVMRAGQSLTDLSNRLLRDIHYCLEREQPDLVLAQGDTTSVMATAMASSLCGIPFGHVESGLRTHRLDAPFPEEANRVAASHLSAVLFAPTRAARDNLVREGIAGSSIHVTGNTVIDALLQTARHAVPVGFAIPPDRRLILVTAHRRESLGQPLRRICQAILELHDRLPDVEFLWPLHPNPEVRPVVAELLGGLPRVRLCEALSYPRFVAAMKRSSLILTDSGGIQEEAPALGKPVLVLRNESERPEALESGVAKLVGQDVGAIVGETVRLLSDPAAYRSMAIGLSPFGDGRAAQRIVGVLEQMLEIPERLRAAS